VSRSRPWAAALALAAACSSDRSEAEGAVRAYDEALVAAYRANDPAPLARRATAREARKLAALIDLKKANGIVLESALEALEVESASRPAPDRLRVSTRERWRYFDRPLAPGSPPGQLFVAVMALDYVLVREGGDWKVDEVRGRSTEYLEPKGWKPHHGASAGPASGR